MEFIIVIVFWIIMLIILGYLFKTSNKKILEIGTNPKLDKIAQKYPENIDICKTYLRMLKNEKVKIEEDENATNSLYIAISDKIIIANIKNTYTRIQTIAHECLHSIQDRKILMFNFIYSNIYIAYFIIIAICAVLKILPLKMMFLAILTASGFIYYFVRSYLENDAMIKARFLAKEYMQKEEISDKSEITEIVDNFDILNKLGIKSVNYMLMMNVVIKIIIFCLICIIR